MPLKQSKETDRQIRIHFFGNVSRYANLDCVTFLDVIKLGNHYFLRVFNDEGIHSFRVDEISSIRDSKLADQFEFITE